MKELDKCMCTTDIIDAKKNGACAADENVNIVLIFAEIFLDFRFERGRVVGFRKGRR